MLGCLWCCPAIDRDPIHDAGIEWGEGGWRERRDIGCSLT